MKDWPKRAVVLPSLRSLAKRLYELNDAFDGPGNVTLARKWIAPLYGGRGHLTAWEIVMVDEPDIHVRAGHESLPGDGVEFDGWAAARRLRLAASLQQD